MSPGPIIQGLWDHGLEGTRLKLVLSGSHVTAMKRLTEADQQEVAAQARRVLEVPALA